MCGETKAFLKGECLLFYNFGEVFWQRDQVLQQNPGTNKGNEIDSG